MTRGGWRIGAPIAFRPGRLRRFVDASPLPNYPQLCNLVLKQPESILPSSRAARRLRTQESLSSLRMKLVARAEACSKQVVVSSGTCGESRGTLEVASALREELARCGLGDQVLFRVTGCHGFCEQEPIVIIQPGNVLYCHVGPQDASEIVSRTVVRGEVIDRLSYADPGSGERLRSEMAVPFYAAQDRLLLGQHQRIDPTSIDDAIANGAYSALAQVLASVSPASVIEEITRSGLRRHVGDGLVVGPSWEDFRSIADKAGKYVVCTVDEEDPNAHIDRTILEGNPHAVLEGMIIGAYATSASAGLIRLRTEHRLALQHTWLAVDKAREYGFLGTDLFDSGFSFDIDITQRTRLPVGRKSTKPAARLSHGAVHQSREASWQHDSAETWARVPGIINNGASWFADLGFGDSTGTKIFSLSGPIRNRGFVEVPMGMSLRTLVLDIGRGIRDGGKVKAVQTGGPSGGCLPRRKFNLSVEYDSLAKAGSIVGSGGIVVMGPETCMVDVARKSLEFLQQQSCGKCKFCRDAMGPMLDIITEIVEGRGDPEQLERLRDLAKTKPGPSVCRLGKTASKPVLSTLKYFRDEYEAHIHDGRCPAGVCRTLVSRTIQKKQDCHVQDC